MNKNLLVLLMCLSIHLITNAISRNEFIKDSLTSELIKEKDDKKKIVLLNSLALNFTAYSYDTAMVLANKALLLAQKIKWLMGEGVSRKQIASLNFRKSNYAIAIEQAHLALAIFDSLRSSSNLNIEIAQNKAQVLIVLGNCYCGKGDYHKAMYYFQEALKIGQEIRYEDILAEAFKSIGLIYYNQGNYSKALNYYFSALKIAEKKEDEEAVAATLGKIGVIYYEQKKHEKALPVFLKTLKINEKLGLKNQIASDLNNIGNVYFSQQKDIAIEYFLKALKIDEELGNKKGMAKRYNNIGICFQQKKNYEEALIYFFKALKIDQELGSKRGMSIRYDNIGLSYIAQKKYEKGKEYLLKSLEIAEDIGSLLNIQAVNNDLFDLYSKMGDYKKALEHFQKSVAARDSLFNQEKQEEITRLEMGYEFDKKEALKLLEQKKKDIENQLLLQKKNQTIYILVGASFFLLLLAAFIFVFYQQTKIKAQQQNMELQQKLLRTQMNPHFIFNALMSIQSFIYENEPKEAGLFLSRFAKLMRTILENSVKNKISLDKEINTLENYLELQKLRFENRFEYTIETHTAIDIENVFIPPMLTQPIIENAIEHGLRYTNTKGLIKVLFGLKNDAIIIEVEDNGIGREKSETIKRETTNSHISLAMDISKERLFILNKNRKRKITLDVVDLKDNHNCAVGTKVIFTIPLKQ